MQSKEGKRPHVFEFDHTQPGTLINPIQDCKYQVIHKAKLSFGKKVRHDWSESLKEVLFGESFDIFIGRLGLFWDQ